jgi:hypothetical protein
MLLISTATAPSSWPKSCRKLIKDVCRFASICDRVASLTCPLHLYCNTARPANTAAIAGTATHRKRRSLACGLFIHFQLRGLAALGPIICADSRLLKIICVRLRSCRLNSRAGPQRSLQQRAQFPQEFGFVNHRLGSASGARRTKPRARVH